MADKTTGKVPRIRFKAYTEPWADEKIGDVIAERRRPIVLEDDQRYELITVKRRNEGVVSRGHLLGRDILVKNYAELKAGDFVISKRQVVHGATGIVPPALDGAIVSNEYLTVIDSKKLLTEFLTIVASLPAMRRKFFLSSYGVDIEKLFFDVDDWKKRSVMLPDVREQSRMGQFFRKLDQLITLHQCKHDKLLTLKKAMLQKMLPKIGAATPEIRFNGFTEAWNQRNLGDISSLQTGYPFEGKKFVDKGILLVRGMNIKRGYLDSSKEVSEYWASIEGFEIFLLKDNDIVIQMDGALIGKSFAKIEKENLPALLVQRVTRIRCAIVNCDFIYANIQKGFLDYIRVNKTETAVPHLSLNDIRNFAVKLPCEAEQQKIGAYFRTLDELIIQHATQLQKLQQIKSSCLAKMFV